MLFLVYVLLGISPASICNLPMFRNHVSVPSSKAGSMCSDVSSPFQAFAVIWIFKSRQKLEIYNMLFLLWFWCIYKMADLKKKQHACIKFSFIWGINATETSETLKVSSQEHGMDRTQVFKWVFKFKSSVTCWRSWMLGMMTVKQNRRKSPSSEGTIPWEQKNPSLWKC